MNNLFQGSIYRPSLVTFSCTKSTIETLEKGETYVLS